MSENEIGKRIKKRREELGMSQTELAKKCGYSSYTTIAKIEAGANNLRQTKVVQISKALDCDPTWLVGLAQPDYLINVNDMFVNVERYQCDPEAAQKQARRLMSYYSKLCNLKESQQELIFKMIDEMEG